MFFFYPNPCQSRRVKTAKLQFFGALCARMFLGLEKHRLPGVSEVARQPTETLRLHQSSHLHVSLGEENKILVFLPKCQNDLIS